MGNFEDNSANICVGARINAAATTCARHPDRPATYYCQKHYRHLCDQCLACVDPKLYCLHRPSCIIWFLDQENRREKRQEERARSETL